MGINNDDGDGGGDRWRWLRGHFPVPEECRDRDFLSPESPLRWRRRCGTFRGWRLFDLGFSSQGLLIAEGARLVAGQGAHTMPWRGLGVPAPGGCGQALALLCLVFWLRESSGKIGTLAFVPSNSENIHFLTSWNQKQATGTVASC